MAQHRVSLPGVMLRMGERLASIAEVDFVFLLFSVVLSGAFGVDDALLVGSFLPLKENNLFIK